MNQELESATVIWYNNEKRYGFARDKWEKQIFFHLNDGRHCTIENGEIKLIIRSTETYGKFNHVPDPVGGDVINFARAIGSKGRPKASPWTFEYMIIMAYEDDGYKMSEYSEPECIHDDCDESYELDQDDFIQVWYTEGPGGHNYYE